MLSRKIYLLSVCYFLGTAIGFGNLTRDTTHIHMADSLSTNIEVLDSINSNFDSNLDSMLNLFHVQESIKNSAIIEELSSDSIPDFPDSVYIQRLAAIPTVINLSYNRIVKNYINAYAMKRRETVEVMLGLSEHYFPIFDEIFDFYDIPNEMKYMSIIESALNPRAYSRARAVGLWQFMYGTGRMYGLEINSLVDERRDPIKATHAAARYSKKLFSIYKDWLLVIAAYNCGPGNVNRAIRRAGGKTNYWDIYYYLPRETRGHVPAFIAATYIMNYYGDHKLNPAKVDIPILTDTIHIMEKLHLQQVSEVLNVPIKQIRDLNPQYRSDIIPAGKKTYTLSLPEEISLNFIDKEDSIYAYKDSIFFDPQKYTISPTTRSNKFIPEAPGKNYEKISYTVKSGDNLGFISEWYNVRISDIKYWNNIRRNLIRSGQKIAIYKPKSKAAKYRDINSLSFAQKQARIGKTVSSSKANSVTKPAIDYSGEYVMYTVRSGDNLWEIAKKFPGVSDSDIMRLNNLENGDKIKPGQKLRIKPKS